MKDDVQQSCRSQLSQVTIVRYLDQMSPPPVQTHRIRSSRPRPALMLQSQPHWIFAQHPSQLRRTAMPGEMARLLVQLHLSASCLSRLVHAMVSLIPFPMFFLPVQTHRISSSRPRPALMLQSQPHVNRFRFLLRLLALILHVRPHLKFHQPVDNQRILEVVGYYQLRPSCDKFFWPNHRGC